MRKWFVAGTLFGAAVELAGAFVACKGITCYFNDDWRALGFFVSGILLVISGALMAGNFVEMVNKLDE